MHPPWTRAADPRHARHTWYNLTCAAATTAAALVRLPRASSLRIGVEVEEEEEAPTHPPQHHHHHKPPVHMGGWVRCCLPLSSPSPRLASPRVWVIVWGPRSPHAYTWWGDWLRGNG